MVIINIPLIIDEDGLLLILVYYTDSSGSYNVLYMYNVQFD